MGRESAELKMLGIVKSCFLCDFFFWMDFLMLRPKSVYVGGATTDAAAAVDADRHVDVDPTD
jgi:hypothetical protein